MSMPSFEVKKVQIPQKTKKPAASFNASGNGPLINSPDVDLSKPMKVRTSSVSPSRSVAAGNPRKNDTPQTRSPAANVNQAQFKNTPYVGKRRAPQGRHAAPSGDTGYRGPHAKGVHAADYNMQQDLDKSRAENPHVGRHSARAPKPEGKHGKAYDPQSDINTTLKKGKKSPYVPKHTPQGQASRAQAARVKARQQQAAQAYGRARNMQHALHMYQRHFSGKHYTEYLRATETRV